jgi:hypothetical protein
MTTLSASGDAGNYTLTGTVTAFGNLPLAGGVNIEDVRGGFTQSSISLKPSRWTFTLPLFFSQMVRPIVVGAGDFNGDGYPDLVTASTTTADSISIFIGNGDGTFEQPIAYSVDANPYAIAVGDFDEDGKLDLVEIGGATSGSISIFTGNGDGTLQLKAHYTTPGGLTKIVIGDYDLDGHADFAIAGVSSHSGVLSIFLGNGDGTFHSAFDYDTGDRPTWIAVGDVNGDGNSDLVVAHDISSQVSIYLGSGDGSFQPGVDYHTSSPSASVAIADVNGDGLLDMVTNFDPTHIAVVFGNGDGTFTRRATYSIDYPVLDIKLSDFDGDGIPDIAIARGGIGRFAVMHGNGDGTFQAYTTVSGQLLDVSLTIADFNGDGNSDIAAAGANPYVVLGQVTADYQMSSISLLGTGTRQIAGEYVGDSLRATSQSAPVALTGSAGETVISLSSSQSTVSFGVPFGIRASFTAARGINPSGSANLMEGKQVLGAVAVENGTAIFNISGLATGSHTLYAVYLGDDYYNNSQSPNLTQVVDRTSAALTVGSSQNPAPFGAAFTLVATTVQGATGTVTFTEGQTVLGTAPLNQGFARLTLSNLSAGSHAISATYSGDQNYK